MPRIKHGMSYTKFYNAWTAMRGRCMNKKNAKYHIYGGRGITVSEDWNDFSNFKRDMYDLFLEHQKHNSFTSLDRIDVNKGYSKENCRWATMDVQSNNKRTSVMYKGETLTQASRRHGLPDYLVRKRISQSGWSVEKALTTPKMEVFGNPKKVSIKKITQNT